MERVVITGIGLVTPNGIGTAESWQSISEGRPGIATITLFDASAYNSQIAGEVKGFDPTQFIEKKKVKEMARFVQLSMAASKLAVEDGHLELSDEERERAGCFIGVGLGGLEGIEAMGRTLAAKGPSRISPYFIPSVIANLAAGQVSMAYGLMGPSYCNTSACSSSAHAIGEALRVDPPRSRRCHGRRRRRVDHHRPRRRRVLRDDRPLTSQRRSRAREPPFRQGARRVRDRRRGGHARSSSRSPAQGDAARRSTPRSPGTARRATRTTSPSPRPKAAGRSARCAWRSKTPRSTRARSTTSTRTAPRPRRATSRNPARSRRSSATTRPRRSSGFHRPNR